jgi:hypothetical protein
MPRTSPAGDRPVPHRKHYAIRRLLDGSFLRTTPSMLENPAFEWGFRVETARWLALSPAFVPGGSLPGESLSALLCAETATFSGVERRFASGWRCCRSGCELVTTERPKSKRVFVYRSRPWPFRRPSVAGGRRHAPPRRSQADEAWSVVLGRGPELGGAAGCEGALPGGVSGCGELGEGLFDPGGGGVAVQQVAELGAGQAVGGSGQGGVDLPGERVAGGGIERPGG